jgi:hypothetical protein
VKGSITIPLNEEGLSVVQRWIDSREENRGLAIAYSANKKGEFSFASRKAPDASTRPLLTVTFTPPPKK